MKSVLVSVVRKTVVASSAITMIRVNVILLLKLALSPVFRAEKVQSFYNIVNKPSSHTLRALLCNSVKGTWTNLPDWLPNNP